MHDLTIVIIGSSAAGMAAAMAARRTDPSVRVIVLERSAHYAVASCGIPAVIEQRVSGVEKLVHADPQEFGDRYGVQLLLNQQVERIRAARHILEVVDRSSGRRFELPYTRLVIATGALPVVPDLPDIISIRYPADIQPLLKHLDAERLQTVHVHGSGVLGLTLAAAFSTRKVTTVLHSRDRILPAFPPDITGELHREREELGILWESRDSFPNYTEPGEIHIAARGIRPNIPAGLRVQETWRDGIPVDRYGRTEIEHIYACGDCARVHNLITREHTWAPGAVTANRTGKIAGANAAGGKERFAGTVAPLALPFGTMELGRAGLSDSALRHSFPNAVRVQGAYRLHPAYISSDLIHMDMAMDSHTGRFLSFHAWGKAGVTDRVNRVATWMQAGLSVKQLMRMETAYYPEFSALTDPLLALVGHLAARL